MLSKNIVLKVDKKERWRCLKLQMSCMWRKEKEEFVGDA